MKKTILLAALLTPLLLFGYQNCSKVQFQTRDDNGLFKASNNPFIDDLNDDGKSDSIPENEIPPVVTNPPEEVPPTVTNPPEEVPPTVKTEVPENPSEFIAQCDQLNKSFNKKAVVLDVGSDIKDKNGNFLAKASNIGVISNFNGNLRLVATSADAKIEKLQNVNGNIILCGFDIQSLENVHGNIVLVGGEILGDINNIKGNGNIKIIP